MSYSEIDICNIALGSLGADSIRSFSEKNKRARMCELFYQATRDYMISEFDWSFARKTKQLRAVETTDVYVQSGMTAYQLPSDCVAPRDVLPVGSRIHWDVQGSLIYVGSGVVDPVLVYTKAVTSPYELSQVFINVLASGIAVRLAPSITQDKGLTKEMFIQFNNERVLAMASDANMGNTYRDPDTLAENDSFVNVEGFLNLPEDRF